MSTYNGEKFLSQQLDSLYNQSGVNIHILVRDDGSSDSTLEILKKYSKSKGNIEVISGKNIGAAKSFFEISHYAQFSLPEYDYYAFCDQDDIWLSDKLISAINSLEQFDNNKLYFCRAKYVDSNLNYLRESPKVKVFDYTTCVYRNPALGCTMVFDKSLLDTFCLAYQKIDEIYNLHDAWMFKCAIYTNASIISDNDIHILYRQHGSNVTTANKGTIKKYQSALSRRFKRKHFYSKNTKVFLEIYMPFIDDEKKRMFLSYTANYQTSIFNTLRFLQKQRWKTEGVLDKALWALLVIFRMF